MLEIFVINKKKLSIDVSKSKIARKLGILKKIPKMSEKLATFRMSFS
jgi:hypothetical protein